jgi:hypothetical protein
MTIYGTGAASLQDGSEIEIVAEREPLFFSLRPPRWLPEAVFLR